MNELKVVNDAIVQEIRIEASAERVFEAISNPRELLKWWASEGNFRTIAAEADLRVGGTWWMQVEGKCGPGSSASTVRGEYRRIERPWVLEFTWNRDGEDWPETLVCWELIEDGEGTTVRVTHSGLTSEDLVKRNSGWPMVQSLLKSYLEGESFKR